MDSLATATVFSTLDCNAGYWQISVAPNDRDKTAFVSHHGLYRFKRMPFGLANAPGTFQRAADVILASVWWQFAIVYLDDIVIYSDSVEQHFEHLTTVLSLLNKAGLTLRIEKCKFLHTTIDYLGHVIRPGKLHVASKNVEAVRNFAPPRTITELRSFLGLCNVYRRFVRDFAEKATPLNRKLRKGEPTSFELNDEEMKSFNTLRDALTTTPVLALPRANAPFLLETDASKVQVGCVLTQEQPDGFYQPIGHWSRSLNDTERNYDTTERECLAVLWSILQLRPYLERTHFVVRTDHDALRWLLNLTDASGKLQRWRLRLAEFSFEVVHRPGRVHQAADALSRLPTTDVDTEPIDDDLPTVPPHYDDVPTVLLCADTSDEYDQTFELPAADGPVNAIVPADVSPITHEEMIREQANDPVCQRYVALSNTTNSVFSLDEHGTLIRTSSLDGSKQIVVPRSLQQRLLYLSHYPLLAGHPGGTKLYETLRIQYYWMFMAHDCYETVRSCGDCAKARGAAQQTRRPLRLFPPSGPFEFIGMDILGPLTRSADDSRFVLVMTDRFTKLARAIPLKSATAKVVAETFLESWIFPYGIPDIVLTDNGPNFVSKFFEHLNSLLGTKHLTTTAYHPQTNGQAERFNRTLCQRLRLFVSEHQTDWHSFVQPLTYAYNSQVTRSTGYTPFTLALTRPPPPPAYHSPRSSTAPGVDTLRDRISTMTNNAARALHKRQQRYKRTYDRSARESDILEPGTRVYLERPPNSAGTPEEQIANVPRTKLRSKATGPYDVVSATRDTVTINVDGIHDTVSRDRITPAPAQSNANVPSRDSEVADVYVVDHIVSSRVRDGVTEYLL